MTARRASIASVALLALVGPATGSLAAGAAPHWSYEGHGGPAHWSSLEPEFASGKTGHAQSPIDIHAKAIKGEALPAIEFAYKPGAAKIVDNGHTIQIVPAPGDAITIAGHRYELTQFHFHKPSEESIDGKRRDMVVHLVHKDDAGKLAVVAVLLQAGDTNPAIAALWNNLPAHKQAEVELKGVQIDPADLLPRDRGYYTFAGSLTTPPCSEGVTWYVLKKPSQVSSGEIARFAKAYPMNARPLQPLNGRVVRASQ
jgi:carbonic anhydrase